MKDSFFTIQEPQIAEFKDRGSKFLAYAYPIQDADEFLQQIGILRKEHLKACHFCYAYRTGMEGENFRANDDGEPSGTAGKPILGQLIKNELTDIGVVVVRYFGGTKLGTSGLINAYKQSTIEVLELSEKVEKIIVDEYRLTFDYGHMGQIMEVVKVLEFKIIEKYFQEIAYIIIGIRMSDVARQLKIFKAKVLQKQLEEITDKTEIPYCKIDLIKASAQ